MTACFKKLLIVLVILTFGISSYAQSSAIKTGPVGFAFGIFSICYEKAVTDNTSFQASLYPYAKVKDYDGASYGAEVEFRLYITKKEVFKGFYIVPKVGATLGTLTEEETGIERDASSLYLSPQLGYQWIWSNGWLLDISLGPKFSYAQGNNTAPEFDGFNPNVNFAFGYTF